MDTEKIECVQICTTEKRVWHLIFANNERVEQKTSR